MTTENESYFTSCLKSLPADSLSLVSTSARDYTLAVQRGVLEPSVNQMRAFIIGETDEEKFRNIVYKAHLMASLTALYFGSTPLIALAVTQDLNSRLEDGYPMINQPIKTERVVRIIDLTTQLQTTDVIKEIKESIEDNFGTIQMLVNRFSKPQSPDQE